MYPQGDRELHLRATKEEVPNELLSLAVSSQTMGTRREALNLRPKEETGESRGGGRPEEKKQRRTSFRHAPVAKLTQNHRKTNPKSTKSTAPPVNIRTITTSPSLQRRWGHTQNIVFVTGSGNNPARTRAREARKKGRALSTTGRGIG
ncbi:hypothetical protein YC2023_032642 [Brassica napus]